MSCPSVLSPHRLCLLHTLSGKTLFSPLALQALEFLLTARSSPLSHRPGSSGASWRFFLASLPAPQTQHSTEGGPLSFCFLSLSKGVLHWPSFLGQKSSFSFVPPFSLFSHPRVTKFCQVYFLEHSQAQSFPPPTPPHPCSLTRTPLLLIQAQPLFLSGCTVPTVCLVSQPLSDCPHPPAAPFPC